MVSLSFTDPETAEIKFPACCLFLEQSWSCWCSLSLLFGMLLSFPRDSLSGPWGLTSGIYAHWNQQLWGFCAKTIFWTGWYLHLILHLISLDQTHQGQGPCLTYMYSMQCLHIILSELVYLVKYCGLIVLRRKWVGLTWWLWLTFPFSSPGLFFSLRPLPHGW